MKHPRLCSWGIPRLKKGNSGSSKEGNQYDTTYRPGGMRQKPVPFWEKRSIAVTFRVWLFKYHTVDGHPSFVDRRPISILTSPGHFRFSSYSHLTLNFIRLGHLF